MRNFRIPRRSFLRGLGGVAVALPALEAMTGRDARARSDGAPLRYLYVFGGLSSGRAIGGNSTVDCLAPDQTGLGYTADKALTPLAEHEVADEVSVVSGMLLPWAQGGSVPPGGRVRNFHTDMLSPLVSGVRSSTDTNAAQGPSSDQVVADEIAEGTLFRALSYRVQAANYRGGNGGGGNVGRITWRRNQTGDIVPIDPTISPRLAYESLFTGFLPTDPEEQAQALALLGRRKSALDLVQHDTNRIVPNLGAADRIRLEQHLDEIRELEKRLDSISDPTAGACEQLDDPGIDPPIGNANGANNDNGGYSTDAGYSNEETRARILFDLVHMAFACDLTRVGSIMMTMAQCFMNLYPIAGYETDMHQSTHAHLGGQGPQALAASLGWHVDHFARLVAKLRDTIDFDGSSMLDNCALVLQFEGGHGFDPQTGSEYSPHSTENMSGLIAGRAGGLNASGGRHIVTNNAHPVQIVNSAMRALGIEQDLGEVTGIVPQLFT
jgi:hypothetical protein